MHKISYIVFIGLFLLGGAKGVYSEKNNSFPVTQKELAGKLQNGDIIFHTSLSEQSKAIQLATNSVYSHCGLIYKQGNEYFVFEAVQPVKLTPLKNWIARGKGGHFIIKRLKNSGKILTPLVLTKMQETGNKFIGKNYDIYFEWSDQNIYCSELIWKIYKESTGLELGKLQHLKDFNLSAKPVQEKMKEPYGNKIPYQENVISPASIFNSDLLETVAIN